ncbi:MAG: corrinoid protein-associated methyltransferase CpaM [Myxococcota bacterium]
MSTYVLMRILESSPRRYDLGMRILTLGRISRAYDRLVRHLEPGQRVLDLGCGTGALTLRAARRGAQVKAIDVSPEMLQIARDHARRAGLAERIEFEEVGIAELGGEPAETYDAVISGLCFSELSPDERDFALAEAVRVLRPGGRLLLADEARPSSLLLRSLHALLRVPLVAITFLVTQQTSHATRALPDRVRRAGLSLESVETHLLQSFVSIVARKPGEEPT